MMQLTFILLNLFFFGFSKSVAPPTAFEYHFQAPMLEPENPPKRTLSKAFGDIINTKNTRQRTYSSIQSYKRINANNPLQSELINQAFALKIYKKTWKNTDKIRNWQQNQRRNHDRKS